MFRNEEFLEGRNNWKGGSGGKNNKNSSRGKYQSRGASDSEEVNRRLTDMANNMEVQRIQYSGIAIITTRTIGFSAATVFSCIYQDCQPPPNLDIYSYYRVSLGLIELRLSASEDQWKKLNPKVEGRHLMPKITCENRQELKSIYMAPHPLAVFYKIIGPTTNNNVHHVPRVLKLVDQLGNQIPSPGNILLSNLRCTVEALARAETPLHLRKNFRRGNPIPGAIWNDDNILTNADEIMPANYSSENLRQDVVRFKNAVDFISKKKPKFLSVSVLDRGPTGTPAQLVTNAVGNVKVVDRRRDEPILDYYRRIEVSGNIPAYWSTYNVSGEDKLYGISSLPCEIPYRVEEWFPNFGPRLRENAAVNILYNAHYSQTAELLGNYEKGKAKFGIY